MRLLSLGCGPAWPETKKQFLNEGIEAISIDILPSFQPDIVRNILRGIPFEDNTFEKVEICMLLEHIGDTNDFVFIMNEIHRVLKDQGTVYITVPHKDSDFAYETLEHVRFFTENSFANFYNNEFADIMGYPVFKCQDVHTTDDNGQKTIHVTLQK